MARSEQVEHVDQVARFTTGVDTVVSRMRALDAAWPPGDGVAVFNRVYLAVTEEVRRAPDAGRFPDRRAGTTLDVRFAELYLTVAERAEPPACWRPLFRSRHHPGVLPVQFALAGVNAHIGHDLALAVVATCRSLGCQPADLQDEFDDVGDILDSLGERILDELTPSPDLLHVADPLTHLISAWSLERAREAAWAAARALWALSELPEIAEEFTRRLNWTVGFASRMLLTPLRR
ncbi:DUF5995 family protein [Streptomyces sp. RY43-2]|uniref:DUF5995 family protein n=1 Tax=Streptomyces macrolidinus TaxID=2952607 RepID=A0ABT0ZB28_9ACTN|nr:DUF5995 family protein [Streptomyces macrolidinus]MCN9240746.1 DUF5995 family protein [Streptomyces macrolidinus]